MLYAYWIITYALKIWVRASSAVFVYMLETIKLLSGSVFGNFDFYY